MSKEFGLFRGKVVDNNDPLNQDRVRALVPAVLGTQRSNWCVPMTRADIERPKVNDTVFVLFLDGEISSPVYWQPDVIRRDLSKLRAELRDHKQIPHG